jgi:AP2 domain
MARRRKASKYLHVYWRPLQKKWEARIKTERVSLGLYDTEEQAHEAVERYFVGQDQIPHSTPE